MPRLSTKQKVLIELAKDIDRRRSDATLRSLLLESDEENSGADNKIMDETNICIDSSTGTIDEVITLPMEDVFERISRQGYAFSRKPYRKGYSKAVFDRDLSKRGRT